MLPRVFKTSGGKLDLDRVRSLWVRFHGYTRSHRWALVGSFCGALGVVGMRVLSPWPIKVIFDYILIGDRIPASSWMSRWMSAVSSGPLSALAWVCGAVLVIAVADAVFCYARDVLLAQTGQRVVGKIRRHLFAHLQTLAPSDFSRYHTGNLLTRLTRDIQMLREMLVTAVVQASESVLLILAMIAVMFALNPVLAVVGLATVPVTMWAGVRISRRIRQVTTKQREKEDVIASVAHDVLGAMSIVQAFNREPIEQERFARENRSSVRAGVKGTRLQSKLYRVVSLSAAVGMCLVLYLGVRSVLSGAMTAGDLLVFVAYLRQVNKPLRRMSKLAARVARATACGQRVAELFAIVPTVRDRPNAITLDGARGRVAFEGVTFAYDDGRPVLSDVSLSIAAGERIAIVGHTGAGKSTLAKLILRFHDPQAGCVRFDEHDVRDVALASLRRHVGWVHQDTVLFGMSVFENIALGRPDADEAEVRAVARLVHADAFIEALPRGYETVLGHGGGTLSGGQRQRIALARALLRSPAVLLLDEPATGLDPVTRESVEHAWMSEQNRATTLVICHRLCDMDRFDRIVVLSHGTVSGCGTHRDLLARCEVYAGMCAAGEDGGGSAGASGSVNGRSGRGHDGCGGPDGVSGASAGVSGVESGAGDAGSGVGDDPADGPSDSVTERATW